MINNRPPIASLIRAKRGDDGSVLIAFLDADGHPFAVAPLSSEGACEFAARLLGVARAVPPSAPDLIGETVGNG